VYTSAFADVRGLLPQLHPSFQRKSHHHAKKEKNAGPRAEDATYFSLFFLSTCWAQHSTRLQKVNTVLLRRQNNSVLDNFKVWAFNGN